MAINRIDGRRKNKANQSQFAYSKRGRLEAGRWSHLGYCGLLDGNLV